MARPFIQIDETLCIECNQCKEFCPEFEKASGSIRPAFLNCIYCLGDCTQLCKQGAIMLLIHCGPHIVLCRDKNVNNFMEEE